MLNIWVGNLGKYNEGELKGGWLGVRIDIWTHFMRGCIMKLCTPI